MTTTEDARHRYADFPYIAELDTDEGYVIEAAKFDKWLEFKLAEARAEGHADGVRQVRTQLIEADPMGKLQAFLIGARHSGHLPPAWGEVLTEIRDAIVSVLAIPTTEPEEMVYVGTPDGSGGGEIPASELDAAIQRNAAARPETPRDRHRTQGYKSKEVQS